ncbi:hypothetical protein C8R44DRAFT_874492 [Mycena epipterygia]|nr:hypothetical protein C8R44DRAFT_874492 [Mycena epipterygia]
MPQRSEVYQASLAGYYLVRSTPQSKNSRSSPYLPGEGRATFPIDVDRIGTPQIYLPFEGQAWFPIDVDRGSVDSPIDVEFWTYMSEHPGNWSADAAQRVMTVDLKIFQCCICWDTLFQPVVPLCMHVFCYKCIHKWLKRGRTSCPVCRAPIEGVPIRDNAFEMELHDAVAEGQVEDPKGGTKVPYAWHDVAFASVV